MGQSFMIQYNGESLERAILYISEPLSHNIAMKNISQHNNTERRGFASYLARGFYSIKFFPVSFYAIGGQRGQKL